METTEQPITAKRPRRFLRALIFLLAASALTLLFVDDLRRPSSDPPAAQLLPDLPAYRQVQGQTITDYIGALGEGAALLAGQPQLAVTIGAVDGVVGCYQEIGGVRARLYSHAERPLEAGLVAVVDAAQVNDPDNFFRCVTPVGLNLESGEDAPQPCVAAYTLTRGNGTFHILYVGSTTSVCHDFCVALEECQVHVWTGESGQWPVTSESVFSRSVDQDSVAMR